MNNCSHSKKELRPWSRATNKTFVPLFQSKSIYVYLRVCTQDCDKNLWHVKWAVIPGNWSLGYRCRWPCLVDNHTRGCCKCFPCHWTHWPPPGPMRPGTPGPWGTEPWSLSPSLMTSLTPAAACHMSCHILNCCIGHCLFYNSLTSCVFEINAQDFSLFTPLLLLLYATLPTSDCRD